MWIVVLMMKLHSYVATNFSMHREYDSWLVVWAYAGGAWSHARVPCGGHAGGRRAAAKASRDAATRTTSRLGAWRTSSRLRRSCTSTRCCHGHVPGFRGRTLTPRCTDLHRYESHYARSERIRKRYVLKKSLQGIGCAALQYVLMAQFILPVLRAEPSRTSGSFVLDLMKLAVPSFVMWLAGFYMLFHCLLNVSAELLRFSDRKFFDGACAVLCTRGTAGSRRWARLAHTPVGLPECHRLVERDVVGRLLAQVGALPFVW